jgi:hypothetical protein
MGTSEAIWDGWYSVAGPVNKFAAYVTMGLGVLAWLYYAWVMRFAYGALAYVLTIWILIFPVVGGILYLVFVQKAVADQDLSKKMHIWLIVAMVVSCVGYFYAGAVMILQFVMVGILSDKPFWVAFGE